MKGLYITNQKSLLKKITIKGINFMLCYSETSHPRLRGKSMISFEKTQIDVFYESIFATTKSHNLCTYISMQDHIELI